MSPRRLLVPVALLFAVLLAAAGCTKAQPGTVTLQLTSPTPGTPVAHFDDQTVTAETVKDVENSTAKRYASTVRLPGFRPGKAPPEMVRKRYKDAIRQEVIERVVQEAYKQVLDNEQIKVAAQPHVHDLKFNDGEEMTFELHVEVRPEINLAKVEGFSVKRGTPEVTDTQVDEQIE